MLIKLPRHPAPEKWIKTFNQLPEKPALKTSNKLPEKPALKTFN